MPGCSIKWCGNHNRNSNSKINNITYHRYPEDPDIKKEWIDRTNRGDDWFPTKYSTICSRHFTPDCFLSIKSRHKLVKTAVPTLHLPVLVNLNTAEASSSSVVPTNDSEKTKRVRKKRKVDNLGGETNSDIEDDYDTWAKECACELRQMDPDQQILAKKAIAAILKEGLLGRLHKDSVTINNNSEQTIQEDSMDPLDEYLVIHKKGKVKPVALCHKDKSSSDLSPSDVGIGATSVTVASHKPVVRAPRAKSKALNKTKVKSKPTASITTKSSVGSSSLDNIRSKFIVTSHQTAASVSSLSSFVKTEPVDDTESGTQVYVASVGPHSLVVKEELSDEPESSLRECVVSVESDPLLVKEPCEETESTVFPASNESTVPTRSSSPVKSEPNSPPPSPDFTFIVKDEPE